MRRIRLAVCQAHAEMRAGDKHWETLARSVKTRAADIALLNEMPFGRWLATAPVIDRGALLESHRIHDEGIARLPDLETPIVLGSRPWFEEGRSVNLGFVWQPDTGPIGVHTKQYFPNEPGYYEANWYDRGETHFRVADAGVLRVGFLICTEIMFNEWARHYGRAGAHLIVVPRATPGPSANRWRTAMQMAAVASGCYVASSNRAGTDRGKQTFGGAGWIVNPAGEVMAETTADKPVVTADIDLDAVKSAQKEYPCYVEELPAVQPATPDR